MNSSLRKLLKASKWQEVIDHLEQNGFFTTNINRNTNEEALKAYIRCYYFLSNFNKVIEVGSKATELFPNNIDILAATASACSKELKHEQALLLWERGLKLLPENYTLKYNYANSLRNAGQISKALDLYEDVVFNGKTENSGCFENYIHLLIKERKFHKAKSVGEHAIKITPNHFPVVYSYSEVLRQLGFAEKSLKIIESFDASKLSTKDQSDYFTALAIVAEDNGQRDRALENCQQALKIDPNNIDTNLSLANLYQTSGQHEEAAKILRDIMNQDPKNCEAHRRYTVFTKYDSTHWHYQQLKHLFDKYYNELEPEGKKSLHFALAKAEEDIGNIDDVMHHLIEGNKMMHEKVSSYFDLKSWMDKCLGFLEVDRALCMSNVQQNRNSSLGEGLIFIVGMPRSGSTLTESILTMAPGAIDLGETMAFQTVINRAADHIDKTKNIQANDLDDWGQYYYELIGLDKDSQAIVTDKNLYNWRHTGLLAHCLPAAKIIHCYRNPMDNILSIFKAHFPLGNEYAFDLDSIFKVYQLQDQCMQYYKQRHTKQIISSNYDQLVSNPEESIRALTQKLNIQWNDAFLRPQDNNRTVRTASSAQVRKSIHSKSVKGWKKFERLLNPYAEGLRRLGYTV